ncbi:PREDICTED: glutamyl aminopeptidase-like [Vollenhovia emeryi]|uniref:glutamyl aminopeptidase-like n=1 Tax=Vollenhovia emeryi TaxID=411798 RepID=UPI0005F4969E|nr:PREDICTED: glutamyl aminopeptidase-like [Vollenhovia emeryi]
MPRRYTEDWFDNMIWTHFYTTPLISTHHVAITVTNFTPIRINKNISLWCRKYSKEHFSFAMHVIENITSYMNSQFRELQIIPKIDHFVIPNFPQDGTSKWGLIFYREADVIYNKQLDPVMHKIEVARCIAHKIAYQVFGNIVSPLRWSYLWLHDGLATIFGEEATAQAFNNYGIMDFFIVRNQYEALNLDSHFDMNPPQVNLSEINSLFNFPRYMKVPIVLRMLKNMMFDHVLRKGVDVYLNK